MLQRESFQQREAHRGRAVSQSTLRLREPKIGFSLPSCRLCPAGSTYRPDQSPQALLHPHPWLSFPLWTGNRWRPFELTALEDTALALCAHLPVGVTVKGNGSSSQVSLNAGSGDELLKGQMTLTCAQTLGYLIVSEGSCCSVWDQSKGLGRAAAQAPPDQPVTGGWKQSSFPRCYIFILRLRSVLKLFWGVFNTRIKGWGVSRLALMEMRDGNIELRVLCFFFIFFLFFPLSTCKHVWK